MYSSDLKRASHTAEIIGKYMEAKPILTPALRERNLGRCCGKSVSWLKENMECLEKTIDDKKFSDAESRREEWNRLFPFYQEIVNNKYEDIVIVSHGDLLSTFHSMWLGLNVESMNTAEIFCCSGGVSVMLKINECRHIIKKISDMSYISGWNRKL